jgi:beta-galactosidase
MIVIGTENGHTVSAWLPLRDNAYMSGQFLWTGIDYLGESIWPTISHNSGLFDRTMNYNIAGLQRESWWSEKPVVHVVRTDTDTGQGALVNNWTPADLGTYDVARLTVYSNCDEVELFLNDKSLGSKPKPANDAPRTWETTFAAGTLKAVGKNNGKEVATEILKTAGEPAKILLTVDKSKIANNFDDVAYVTATIVDANGLPCPNVTIDRLVSFTISGPGAIAAVDNGDNQSHEAFQANERSTYRGKCIAVIRAKGPSGTIGLKASAPNLEGSSVTITIVP